MTLQKFLHDFAPFVDITYNTGILFLILLLSFIISAFLASRLRAPFNIFVQEFKVATKIALGFTVVVYLFQMLTQALKPKLLDELIHTATFFATTFLILFYLNSIINKIYEYKRKEMKKKKDLSRITQINGIKHIVKLVLFTLVLITMMDYMQISYAGLVAVAGAGSLASAFAAKEIVENMFGGLVIFIDQPFKVGDFISSPDRKIEGTVEHIGWRATEIITLDKVPIIVPNGAFISIVIQNYSKREARRFSEVIGVCYQDFDKIPGLVNSIKNYIDSLDFVDHDQSKFVHLIKFNASSIDIGVKFILSSTQYGEFRDQKEEVLSEIGRLVIESGSSMAFPTITIDTPELEVKTK